MAKIRLRVIPEPEEGTRAILVKGGDEEGTVYIRGEHTGRVHVCGACDAPLMEGVSREQVGDAVLQCPACGAFNEAKTYQA